MTVGENLGRLLEKLAGDKPVVSNNGKDLPEFTILKRGEVTHGEDSMKTKDPESKDVVRTLVEKIPEAILKRTTLRRKRMSFKEEAEYLGLDQESCEWLKQKDKVNRKVCQGIQKKSKVTRRKVMMSKTIFARY